MGWATLSGPVAVDEERLEAAARNLGGEKREQNYKRDFSELVARRSSERKSLALLRRAFGWETEKRDLRSSAKTKAVTEGKKQLGRLGVEEDEEEDPVTERRKEYTDLGLDLGERKKQVACPASALVLVMTDEARRKALR